MPSQQILPPPAIFVALGVLVLAIVSTAGLPAREPDQRQDPEPDPRVAWLRDHAVELSTIEPDGAELEDLEPLKEILDGVRVVMLGEATRGDGSTFLAKTRLIRFLHREMGFDVLALECDFSSCQRAGEALRAGTSPGEALTGGPMALYTESAQFQPLLDWVADPPDGERPLVLAGIDPQLAVRGEELMADLGRVLERSGSDPETIPDFGHAAEVVGHLARGTYPRGDRPVPSRKDRRRFRRALEAIGERLEAPDPEAPPPEAENTPSRRELAFWRQVLDNLDAEARATWELGVYRSGEGVSPEVTTLRNRQMAENVLWLAERAHPESKIVVWSQTVLLARDPGRLDTGDLDTKARLERFVTIGDVLEDELRREATHVIAFTASAGHSGTPFRAPYRLLDPTPGSFEEVMARTGLEAAFVDLRDLDRSHWLSGPVIARPLSYKELRGSWPRHLDAFVFLRTQNPSRGR